MLTDPLSFDSLFRFSRATGAPSRDRGTTQVGSGITAAPTMTGTLAGLTTVTRATEAPPVQRHSTLTTQEVRPARPHPPTTRSVPLTTGCPKDNRGRTALDIGTPSNPHQELHQTCLLTLALPLPYYPHSTALTNSCQWRIAYQFTYFCQLSCSSVSVHQSFNLKIPRRSLIALHFALIASWLKWHAESPATSQRSLCCGAVTLCPGCKLLLSVPETDRITCNSFRLLKSKS